MSWYLFVDDMCPICSNVRRFLWIFLFFCSRGSCASSTIDCPSFISSGALESLIARLSMSVAWAVSWKAKNIKMLLFLWLPNPTDLEPAQGKWMSKWETSSNQSPETRCALHGYWGRSLGRNYFTFLRNIAVVSGLLGTKSNSYFPAKVTNCSHHEHNTMDNWYLYFPVLKDLNSWTVQLKKLKLNYPWKNNNTRLWELWTCRTQLNPHTSALFMEVHKPRRQSETERIILKLPFLKKLQAFFEPKGMKIF